MFLGRVHDHCVLGTGSRMEAPGFSLSALWRSWSESSQTSMARVWQETSCHSCRFSTVRPLSSFTLASEPALLPS